ncbi:MAG: hypothetical protein JRN19_05005 [Nitrososphaerota archaeon]|nr:hypothetical protein [Nitrososphaerota archaeon]MDG7047864.1 hypothetical protein [Nitrososphaerota archaeon]MDG7048973.1 hypothetical protein [Nitrososphaerota archaeon]MDG7051792.1 hypothetical protein [Nitrososphaerota archaeon]
MEAKYFNGAKVRMMIYLAKRTFTIEMSDQTIQIDGYDHRKVLIKYLMKRRRSLLSTRDPKKVELLWEKLPKKATVKSVRESKTFDINWKLKGEGELTGARFVFDLVP